MVLAIYLPDDIAQQFKADRLQGSLHKLRLLAEKLHKVDVYSSLKLGVTDDDVKLMQQLEVSFCMAREVNNQNETLVDQSGHTHVDKLSKGGV